jgi:hypothetical protein
MRTIRTPRLQHQERPFSHGSNSRPADPTAAHRRIGHPPQERRSCPRPSCSLPGRSDSAPAGRWVIRSRSVTFRPRSLMGVRAGSRDLCGQFGVAALAGQQAGAVAGIGEMTVVEQDDLVGVADGGQPVRDGDGGAALGQGVESLLDGRSVSVSRELVASPSTSTHGPPNATSRRPRPSPLTRPTMSRWPTPSAPSRASSARSQPRRRRRGTSRPPTCAPCARRRRSPSPLPGLYLSGHARKFVGGQVQAVGSLR